MAEAGLLAVSSWSFHAELYAGRLHVSEVPFRAYELGFRAVELQDMFLWPPVPNRLARWLGRKADPFVPQVYHQPTLRRLKLNRVRSGTKLVAWDIDTDLAAVDSGAQRAYLARAIETARWLSAPVLRVTLGGAPADRAGYQRAVEVLSSVLPVAIASNVRLAIENHDGLSADPQVLLALVTHFHSPHLGVCLDVGNFQGEGVAGVQALAPYALHVHAKARSFAADGEEAGINYRACMSALKAVHYAGAISIEYEGPEAEYGIKQTRALIEKYI